MSYYNGAYRNRKNLPKKGDFIQCLTRTFEEYALHQKVVVQDALYDVATAKWKVKLPNSQSPVGHTWYLAENWRLLSRGPHNQESEMAAYEKTKYFAIRMDEEQASLAFASTATEPRDLKSDTLKDVKEFIQPGERWMVLQTICLVEVEDPKPPIRVTEYK